MLRGNVKFVGFKYRNILVLSCPCT